MDGFYHFDAGTTVQPVAGLRGGVRSSDADVLHAARRADTRDGDGRVHGGAVTALLALAFSGVLPALAVCATAALLGWS